MHEHWNPWHGCKKISEGCENCYMYFLDQMRNQDGSNIYRTKANFDYPLHKNRKGGYKVASGATIRVCMTSDFFLEEADAWREEAWEIMHLRSDVKFHLLTKRPQRVAQCLPKNWDDGWENVLLSVTCENQRRADERIPILLDLPFCHKGINCSPLIGQVCIEPYLKCGQIELVESGGENYDGARICKFEWVQELRRACEAQNVSFHFYETGTRFVKDRKLYVLQNKRIQSQMARKSGMSFLGKPIEFRLTDTLGREIPAWILPQPHFQERCETCSSQMFCDGCGDCGKCTTKRKME